MTSTASNDSGTAQQDAYDNKTLELRFSETSCLELGNVACFSNIEPTYGKFKLPYPKGKVILSFPKQGTRECFLQQENGAGDKWRITKYVVRANVKVDKEGEGVTWKPIKCEGNMRMFTKLLTKDGQIREDLERMQIQLKFHGQDESKPYKGSNKNLHVVVLLYHKDTNVRYVLHVFCCDKTRVYRNPVPQFDGSIAISTPAAVSVPPPIVGEGGAGM